MNRIIKISMVLLLIAGLSACVVDEGPGYGHCWQNWRGVTHCN